MNLHRTILVIALIGFIGAPSFASLPASFDWRTMGWNPPARNQGQCGSAFAFATLAPLEWAIKIYDGWDADLSEQWLVNCNTDGWGCVAGGGYAFDYLKASGGKNDACGRIGAVLESDYPYTGTQQVCDCNRNSSTRYYIQSWAYVGNAVSVPSVDAIKDAIYNHGPVACFVYADTAFQFYSGGIFYPGSSGTVNHLVVLVGWGSQGGTDYWILRNSWGTWWGENGYMKIKQGVNSVGYGAAYITYLQTGTKAVFVSESNGITSVSKSGLTDTYSVRLSSFPSGTVQVGAYCNSKLQLNNNGAGNSIVLNFDQTNWSVPQTVTVAAINDGVQEGPHDSVITHDVAGGGYEGVTVNSVIAHIAGYGHWCGEPNQVYLSADFNHDCYVNLADFADFASQWLKCTNLGDPACSWTP
jgi:hypothetical protein